MSAQPAGYKGAAGRLLDRRRRSRRAGRGARGTGIPAGGSPRGPPEGGAGRWAAAGALGARPRGAVGEGKGRAASDAQTLGRRREDPAPS